MKAVYILPLMVLLIPQAFALEADEFYLLEDTKSISLAVSVDSQGNAHFEDAIIVLENGPLFFMDAEGVKVARITSDHSEGMIIGQSEDGSYALIRYHIEGDNVTLKAKVWASTGTERIMTQGNIIPIF